MVGFLAQQRFAVVTTVDHQGRSWASLIAGEPGMLAVPDQNSVRIDAALAETKLPLADLGSNPKLGMLAIDLTRRIRVRINGEASAEPDGSVLLSIRQLYGNCSQYIQRRTVSEPAIPTSTKPEPQVSSSLGADQVAMIAKADTLFLGSVHPESGADASHRGGLPGFVQVLDPNRISFPDYSGNNMFNTLGNIEVNPAVGVLFSDFESGRTLQLTGRASVDWDETRSSHCPGAHRMIDIAIDEVRDTRHATNLRYQFEAYSPFLKQE